METRKAVLAVALFGVAAFALTQSGVAQAAFASDPNIPPDTPPDTPDIFPAPLPGMLDAPTLNTETGDNTMSTQPGNVDAFLAMLRQFETRNRYNLLYGGATFADFSHHPFLINGQCDPSAAPIIRIGVYAGQHSTAAGAYQILCSTYLRYARSLGINDFSPDSQDRIALAILSDIGAVSYINAGNIAQAIAIASRQWASLPGSTAGQNPQTLQTALATYDSFNV